MEVAVRLSAIGIVAAGALCSGLTLAASLDVDLSFDATASVGFPPDTMGAVGPEHVVTFTNGGVEVFRKSDGMPLSQVFLEQFWSDAGVVNPFDTFDPRVVYDPQSERFLAVSLNGGLVSNQILVAVSSTSDPSQPWTGFAVDVLVIPKSDLLAAQPTISGATLFERTKPTVTGYARQPVTRLDGGGLPNWLFSSGVAFLGLILTTHIDGSATAPTIAAGPFTMVDPMGTPPEAIQPNATLLDTGDGHFASLVRIGDSVWGVHGTRSASERAAIRWFEFDANNAAVVQSGVIDDPSRDFLYPSIAVNALGQVVIGFSASGSSLVPSAFAVFGETVAGVTTFHPPILVRAGITSLTGGGVSRFGDYSATVADPGDASRFWTFQEVGGPFGEGMVTVASLRVVPEAEATPSALAYGLVLRALAGVRSGHCDRARRRRTLRRFA
jgi:hypothetical protein